MTIIGIDWNSTLQNQIGEICNRTCLLPSDFDRWDPPLGSRVGMTEAAFTSWAWGNESIQAMAEPYQGAASTVTRLREAGATIWIVTSTGCPMLVTPWLRRWKIPFDRAILTDDKESIEWDVLLDDNPFTLERAAASGRRVLRHRLPWNSHLEGIEGFSWESLISYSMGKLFSKGG